MDTSGHQITCMRGVYSGVILFWDGVGVLFLGWFECGVYCVI